MTETAPKLPSIEVKRLTGEECFSLNNQPLEVPVIEFWRWSTSDLVSNATRGVLAEFIVAMALGVQIDRVREEWAPYDLLYPNLKIEVKSAAYIQSWYQENYSNISFSIRPARSWDPQTNKFTSTSRRQGDLYVFCLLQFKGDKNGIDPLNLDQWCFYVVPASAFETEKHVNQARISLASLQSLGFERVMYPALKAEIEKYQNLGTYQSRT